MKRLFLITLLLAFSFAASAEVVERVVAVVNDDVVTLYDVEEAMAPEMNSIKVQADKQKAYATVRSRIINLLVDNKLLDQAMTDAKVEVTTEDVNRQIKGILDQNHIPIEVLKSELAKNGISFADYKKKLEQDIRRQKFINGEVGPKVNITETDMRNYYREHMMEFEGGLSVSIAQIVLPFTEGMTKTDLEAMLGKARGLVSQIRGGASFAEIAKANSKGPNAENGGDLGIVNPKNLLPQVAGALTELKVGQVSEPVMTPMGVVIVKLIDRPRATNDDFTNLKDFIYQKLYSQQMDVELTKYIQGLRKKSYIDIRN